MTRRPPPLRSSPYVTPAGYLRLTREHEALWARRREVVAALAAAAAEGDRSENAEYLYRKKELRELDRRIRYLQKRLPLLKVVTEIGDRRRIFFGARVRLRDEAGDETLVRIVGPDESDAEAGSISVDSPLARALLNKTVGDNVQYRAGGRMLSRVVHHIDYPD